MKNLKTWSRRLLSSTAIIVLFSCITPYVSGYGRGAPPAVCGDMKPSHGAEPQTSENPYKVVLSKTNVQGTEQIDITITSKSGNDEFKGFFVQVRKPGSAQTVGKFSEIVEGDNARPVTCSDNPNSGMTHISGTLKKSVTVHWIAPNKEDGEYEVYYTVVGKEFNLYWVHHLHDEKIRVTRNAQATEAPAVQAASEALVNKWREFYDGCGVSKGCFGMPGNCVENFDKDSSEPEVCSMMVTWADKGGKYTYELTGNPGGTTQGYVAMGFSEDTSMGADSVVGCAFRSGGQPTVERYHNPGTYNIKHTDPKLGVTQKGADNVDGHLFCSFEQTNHDLDDINVNIKDKSYHLLLSRAASVPAEGLGQHAGQNDKGYTPNAVHISDIGNIGATAMPFWLVQLHGGLMLIAWLMCASTGMFTARYYKLTHTEFMPCGKAFWFALHVFCMAATAFLTIAGAVLILIHRKGKATKDWHPVLGFIVVGLALLQVLIAFFRPHPGTKNRPLFNWVHWGIGNSAHIIGIACIFLARDLSLLGNQLQQFSDSWLWIMLGLVLFHVLMHIVMSIHTLWADKEQNSNNKKRAMQPGPMKPNGISTEAPGTGFRTFMLSLYLLVMAGGAIALTILVFLPESKDTTS